MANEPASADQRRTTSAAQLPRKASLLDPSQCTLYFLAGAGLIKIGITTNLTSRFRAIKNASPVPIVILATMPGCTFIEGRMHQRFAHLRRHGEWFTDDGEIRRHIEELAKVGKAEFRTFGPCLAKQGKA